MKEAGIREARQNLTALIDEVRKGQEVTITDRGRPVARLVPPRPERAKPFAGRADFRRRMPVLQVPLTETLIDERAERAETVIIEDTGGADSGSFCRLELSPLIHRQAERLILQVESLALRTLDALHWPFTVRPPIS